MMHGLIVLWFGWVRDWGYPGIALLMAMESSIVPVPSEVVIPPAAYWAAEGRYSLGGVILAGTIGSYAGAAITYGLSRWLGRVLVARWGRWFLITPDKLDRAERFLHRYEVGGIFFSRLLPVVRHLIGIPAGLMRMDFRIFSVMTLLGSGLWCSILAWYGQSLGSRHPGAIDDPEKLMAAVKADGYLLLPAILVLCALYLLVMRLTARPATAGKEGPAPASSPAGKGSDG